MDIFTVVLVLLGCLFLFLACFGWNQPRISLAIEQWSHLVPGLQEPADLFYARIYQRLKEQLAEVELPDTRVGFGPGRLFGNRTIFGARPQYLIVRYSHITIYIYAFSSPGGIYVSYWAFSKYTLWLEHPILKWLVFWRSYQMTLYQFDVTSICLGLINGTIHEVIDDYCEERGLKPLEDYERRPILHSFYAKYKQGNLPPSGYALPIASAPIGAAPVLPPSGPPTHPNPAVAES